MTDDTRRSRPRCGALPDALAIALSIALAGGTLGCAAQPATGSAMLAMSAVQDIARVTVTVTGPGISPDLEVELVQTAGVWGGIIGEIPAGPDRSFHAIAYDASDTPLYEGQADDVTITANAAIVVMITLQQIAPAATPTNAAPIIDYVTASANGVAPGEQVALTAAAHDDDGDPIAFTWNANGGGFGAQTDTASTTTATWTAPATPGPYTITITATDPEGAQAAVSLDIDVQDAYAGGAAIIGLSFVDLPDILGVTAVPGQLTPSSPSVVLDVLVDPSQPNPLAFAWTKSACGGGSFADTGTASSNLKSPTYTANPGALTSPNTCVFTVTVTDTITGAASARTLLIGRGPDPVNIGPQIVVTYQSVAQVAPGGTVLFRADATDPEGQPLAFTWNASDGGFGAPTDTPTTSEIVWTAPACADSAITASVAVTDAVGLTDSADFLPIALPPGSECSAVTGWVIRDTIAMSAPDVAILGSMTMDAAGNLYVGGRADDAGQVNHWIVRKSTDGLTWSTVRDQTPPDVPTGDDFSPSLIAVGTDVYMTRRNASDSWLVDKSSDGGASWANVDSFQLIPGLSSVASGLAADDNGAVYVSGAGADSTGVAHCLVRRSTDAGATWAMFVDYQLAAGVHTECGFHVMPSGTMVLVGSASTPVGPYTWWFRRSTDGGATWQLTDTFQLVPGEKAGPRTGALNSGVLMIAGYAFDGTSGHWVVRTSADSGLTWQLTDDFIHRMNSSNDDSGPFAAAEDQLGRLRLSGFGDTGAIHRISADSGATWADATDTPAEYLFLNMYRAGPRLFATGLVIDPSPFSFTSAAVFEYVP